MIGGEVPSGVRSSPVLEAAVADLWNACLRGGSVPLGHGSPATAFDVDWTAGVAISGARDGTLRVWSIAEGRETVVATLGGREPRVATVLRGGGASAVGFEDGSISVFTHQGDERARWRAGPTAVTALCPLPDSDGVVAGHDDGSLSMWSGTGAPGGVIAGSGHRVNGVACAAPQRWLLSGGRNNLVVVRSLDSGEVLHSWKAHSRDVTDVTASADGNLAATCGKDGLVRVWSLTRQRLRAKSPGFSGVVGSVRFLTTSSLVVGAHDHRATEWRFPGRRLAVRASHGGPVTHVRVSPDGSQAASVSVDGSIRVWDRGGQRRQVLAGIGLALQSCTIHDSVLSLELAPSNSFLERQYPPSSLWQTARLTPGGLIVRWRTSPAARFAAAARHCADGDGCVRSWSTAADGLMVRSHPAGPISVHDVTQGRDVVQMLFLAQGGWVTWTPAGGLQPRALTPRLHALLVRSASHGTRLHGERPETSGR